jgi:hypothetical protein
MYELLDSLLWLPAVIAGGYVLLPLLTYFTLRLPARPDMVPLELKALSRDSAEYLMTRTQEMIALGFADPVLARLPNAAPNVTGYLILLANRPAGDMAMVTVLVGDNGLVRQKAFFVEFSTGSADATSFDTNNTDQLNAFPPMAGTVRTQARAAADATELYRLHRHVMAAHNFDGPREVYPLDDALEWLTDHAFERMYEANAARGWLVRTRDGEAFVPTLYGAYLMTWGLIPPLSWVRKLWIGRHAARLLAEVRRSDAAV